MSRSRPSEQIPHKTMHGCVRGGCSLLLQPWHLVCYVQRQMHCAFLNSWILWALRFVTAVSLQLRSWQTVSLNVDMQPHSVHFDVALCVDDSVYILVIRTNLHMQFDRLSNLSSKLLLNICSPITMLVYKQFCRRVTLF